MKLEQLRRARALSIDELAKAASVAPSTISDIERGRSKPRRFETVRKLAAALQAKPQYIDEFQHLVGVPESLLDTMSPAQLQQVQERLDKVDFSATVPLEDILETV